MTYGWAILVVLVIVGILFFSGSFTDPTRFLPEECEFYITVVCLDHLVEKDEIALSVKNEAEREIIVENIIATSDALNGQCELTGIHRGKSLKNGDDFLFKLNLTNKATIDQINADPPESTGISWNLPDDEILLARAAPVPDMPTPRDLRTLLKDHGPDSYFGPTFTNLSPDSQAWFARIAIEEALFGLSLDEPSDLEAYKTNVTYLLQKRLDNATNRSYAASDIFNKSNESNSSITKSVIWDIISNETERIFIPPSDLGEGITLREYVTGYENHEGKSIENCEDFDNLEQARLNYAAFKIFEKVNFTNAQPTSDRQDLYGNLSESIIGLETEYEGLKLSEDKGLSIITSILRDVLQEEPIVKQVDRARLTITDSEACSDGFRIAEITLNNSRLAEEIGRSDLILDETGGVGGGIVGKISGPFGNDAYCTFAVLLTPRDSFNLGYGGGREDFDGDGVPNTDDDNNVLFLRNLLAIDRLSGVSTAVDSAVDKLDDGSFNIDEYKFPESFNGADMDIVLKMIQSDHGARGNRLGDLVDISHITLGTIFTNPTLNLDSPPEDIAAAALEYNSDWLRLNKIAPRSYLGDYIEPIVEIIVADSNVRRTDKIIQDFDQNNRRLTLDPNWIVFFSNLIHKNTDHRLDFNRLSSHPDQRISEIILIIDKIREYEGPFTDENDIIRYVQQSGLDFDDYGDIDSISAIIELTTDIDGNLIYSYGPPFTILDNLTIAKIINISVNDSYISAINRHSNTNEWEPQYNPHQPLRTDADSCFNYPSKSGTFGFFDQRESVLVSYLNSFYDSTKDDPKLYVDLDWRWLDSEEKNHPDPSPFVPITREVYYNLTYHALVYASVLNVSSASAADRSMQAAEIKKSVNLAAFIFLFNIVNSPYSPVKNEYLACYDTSLIFTQDGYGPVYNPYDESYYDPYNPSYVPDDFYSSSETYRSHCMVDAVKNHFENFNYTTVLEGGVTDEELELLSTDPARFYTDMIDSVRAFISESIRAIEEAVRQLLPTSEKVCEAAEDAAKGLKTMDSSHRAKIDLVLGLITDQNLKDSISNIINRTNVDDFDRANIRLILDTAGVNETDRDKIISFSTDGYVNSSDRTMIRTILDSSHASVISDINLILNRDNVDNFGRADIRLILDTARVSAHDQADILSFLSDGYVNSFYRTRIHNILDSSHFSVISDISLILDRADVNASDRVDILGILSDPNVDASYRDKILSILDSHLARSAAAEDLLDDFANIVNMPFNYGLVNTNGDLNCDVLIPGSFSISDILDKISSAASGIIDPAQKDIGNIPHLIDLINRWPELQNPPTVEINPSIPRRIASTLKFNVTVEDKDGDLDRLEINIVNVEVTPPKRHLLSYSNLNTHSDFECADLNDGGRTCNVTVYLSELIPLLKQGLDDPDEDLVINIAARVTDEQSPTPGVGRNGVIGIEISSTPPPVVESFEIISMEHIDQGEYYTQVVVEVNATQRWGGGIDNITLSLPSAPTGGLNSHLNQRNLGGDPFRLDLRRNISFFNYDYNQPPSVTIPNALLPPNWNCDSVLSVDGVTTCTKQFTITVSKELNNNVIWLTAKAGSTNGVSGDFNKKLRIPAESIPGCQYLDIGKSKNRYNLKLIYAWAESPGIFHTVTGTMLANSPE